MNTSEIIIRIASQKDMVSVATLIQELAEFEKMPDGPKIGVQELQKDGFESSPPAFRCIVAELSSREQNAIVGYALYFPTYSTWEGRTMMLQNFYVATSARQQGIGNKLFKAVAKEALISGCTRLEFHVLQWNNARTFYERKGAINLTSVEQWCYYRLSGDALRNAADEGKD